MKFYDSVFQSLDCPEDYIINNNYLLDQWYESKIKEQEANRRESSNKERGVGSRSALNHSEVTFY